MSLVDGHLIVSRLTNTSDMLFSAATTGTWGCTSYTTLAIFTCLLGYGGVFSTYIVLKPSIFGAPQSFHDFALAFGD